MTKNDELFAKLAQDERDRYSKVGDPVALFTEIQDIQLIDERGCEYRDKDGERETFGDLWRAPAQVPAKPGGVTGWRNKPHRYLYDALRQCGLLFRALAVKDNEITALRAENTKLRNSALAHAVRMGEDIHTRLAAEMYDIPEEVVTTEQGNEPKARNFGKLFGMNTKQWQKSLRAQTKGESV